MPKGKIIAKEYALLKNAHQQTFNFINFELSLTYITIHKGFIKYCELNSATVYDHRVYRNLMLLNFHTVR